MQRRSLTMEAAMHKPNENENVTNDRRVFFSFWFVFVQADWRLFESKPYSFVWLRFKHTHRAPWDALFCNAAEMEQVEFESPWKLCRTLLGLSAPLACFPFVYGLVQERLRLMSCFSQKEPHNDSCLPLIRSSKENELPLHRYSSVKKYKCWSRAQTYQRS